MPEPLKNLYNKKFINLFCGEIAQAYPNFNTEAFTKAIFNKDWKNKELKQRMRHITETLHLFLPASYKKSIQILKKISREHSGFEYMIFPDYVELYGLNDLDESIKALEFFTKFSSSEFAVRPFIIKYPKKMMTQMTQWATSNSHHVRRLASEGCRPRLPWAMGLPEFKNNPNQVIRILKKLRNDKSEYVRRSVANNLNDISKDNPKTAIEIAKQWKGKNKNTDWLVKHACRTLLKQGNPDIMKLYGYKKPKQLSINNFKIQKKVRLGDKLEFSFNINTNNKQLGKLRIEYAVYFLKKNASLSPKVFKISESDYTTNKKTVSKYHSFKLISTRKYYAGVHALAIIINGHELAKTKFTLTN